MTKAGSNGSLIRRLGISTGLAIVVFGAFSGLAHASAPPAPPQGACTTVSPLLTTPGLPIPDNTTTSSPFVVAGFGPYVLDVDLQTNITHTFAADLDITLTSPAGTVVTLTTDNGAGNDNVFNGTVWDDDGGDTNPPGAVTDTAFANDVVETTLVPEEALGAFVGENPNGTWTLAVADDAGGDTGTLASWSLQFMVCSTPPPTIPVGGANTTPAPILDVTTTASVVSISGACPYLQDLDVTTAITHAFPTDLDITLVSPAGTEVTMTTDNGGSATNAFNGTVWNDDAGDTNPPGAVTDTSFAANVVETALVPEEALGAFVGENPNGTWTLRIFDDFAPDGGTLNSWNLSGQAVCAPPPPAPVAAPVPALRVTDAAVREGNGGLKAMRFLVRLSAPNSTPVTVQYVTRNGTAKAPSDYRKKSGTLTFAPGVTTLPVRVLVRGDRRDERNERFFLSLSAPGNATLADARGRGLIRDNDP